MLFKKHMPGFLKFNLYITYIFNVVNALSAKLKLVYLR